MAAWQAIARKISRADAPATSPILITLKAPKTPSKRIVSGVQVATPSAVNSGLSVCLTDAAHSIGVSNALRKTQQQDPAEAPGWVCRGRYMLRIMLRTVWSPLWPIALGAEVGGFGGVG